MLQFYRQPALSASAIEQALSVASLKLNIDLREMTTEWCYYLQTNEDLTPEEFAKLTWLLSETFEPNNFCTQSFLNQHAQVLEIGPRLNFETAWSTTAVSVCHACGLRKVIRLERAVRFGLPVELNSRQVESFLILLHDRMTEMRYEQTLQNFDSGLKPKPVQIIPVMENGIEALQAINKKLGLAMDKQDQAIYLGLVKYLKRNCTDVEFFQLGQANSEHSRHPFFRGNLVIDGQPIEQSLMDIIKAPWKTHPNNSLIAFCDDSSAIAGFPVETIVPEQPGQPCLFVTASKLYHPTLTAETHNFPSGVAPYPGAETGTGGRIRDNQAVGRGGLVIAGGAAYCVGNLHIPGYDLPWEKDGWQHPETLASPLDILVEASNGASDYGNCFGEPIIYGFTRTFGQGLAEGYRSWYKPIMYTVGAGQISDNHTTKHEPKKGMLVVQVGGPAYRIGMGGASASSKFQGENVVDLDLDAVQRGDAQMEQRVNRAIRAFSELEENNPIVSIHDLGAGGDCNALPELVYPAGAKINLRSIPLGDQSLSVLEYWGNESQERNAFLIWPDRFDQIKAICDREGVPCAIVGQITGDGWLILHDENDGTTPVNLPLDKVLGDIPPKTFELKRIKHDRPPLELPDNLMVKEALDRVLRLPSVGSKRFLTTKVDRSVTGLISQQQCVGPNQLTLSDYAIIAQSHFGLTGTALSLGEQPIKGLIDPKAMARLAVSEALLNMIGAKITALDDIKYSANWMLAAKLPGEGAWLYDAACALRDIAIELGIAPDGGKDSLSMAAKTTAPDGNTQMVKAPGQLVVANYATMVDITRKVTPDLKKAGNTLLFIDLAKGKNRLGGSALAQVYGQVGNECPDVEDVDLLKRTFETVQFLIQNGSIAAIHDRSDGGLIVALLEMAFAGNVGLDINLTSQADSIATLFSEEPGLVIECADLEEVMVLLNGRHIPVDIIGKVADLSHGIIVKHNEKEVLDEEMDYLRFIWEETSTAIDKKQANLHCVLQEAVVNRELVTPPPFQLSFSPLPTPGSFLTVKNKPRVAILREQGSNGDREMASAFYLAGFEVWDVTMTDLLFERVSLDDFQGIAFVGGFSFADVLDASKGWAGVIRFNEKIAQQFARFYKRQDTFSLGVCNGCQLMALLGWVPWPNLPAQQQPRFIRNESGRFESRFSTVKVMSSPAIMLKNMEGSILGIWIAHGEGRLHVSNKIMLDDIMDQRLTPLQFVDSGGHLTNKYPFNPNGSPQGITALCSPCGRHLAMMPHPERTFLLWQWPWLPADWLKLPASPWLKLFQNAYHWCMEQRQNV